MGLLYAGILMMADQLLLGGALTMQMIDGVSGMQRNLRYELLVLSLD